VPIGAYAIIALAGYLLGSIPTGYLVARARGVDIRQAGSGNIGATNVFRILGKPAGIFVLLVDAAKGFAAAGAAMHWFPGLQAVWPEWLGAATTTPDRTLLAAVAGVAAILGHNYTCWLGFKGGKGIATSAGVLLVLMPAALGICVAVWLVVFALSRYVSLASILAAAVLAPAVWLTRGGPWLTGVAALLAALAIYKHRTNIRRLRDGTEHRFGRPKPAEATKS
jgi:glycerol-3-phosphate acyltransferase PlsY